jgi:hypothetical protein
MKFGRALVLVAVAFVVAGLSGMATLIVRAEAPADAGRAGQTCRSPGLPR